MSAVLVAGSVLVSCGGAGSGEVDAEDSAAAVDVVAASVPTESASSVRTDAVLDVVAAEQMRVQIDEVIRTLSGDAQQDRDAVYFDRQWRYNVDVQTCVEAAGQEYPLLDVTYGPQVSNTLEFDWWSELDAARAANGFGYNILEHGKESNPAGIPGYDSMSSSEQDDLQQLISRCGGMNGPSVDDPYPEAASLLQELTEPLYAVVLSAEFGTVVEGPYRQCMDDAGLDIDWELGLPDWVEGVINQSYYEAQIDPFQPGNDALKQQNRDFEVEVARAYVACRAPLLPLAMTLCQPVLNAFLADHAEEVDVIRAGWKERGDEARADMVDLEAAVGA